MDGRVIDKELARLLDLLSHENRIALVKGIAAGKTPQTIADECGVSRQTLQGHITKLKDGNLIERRDDGTPYQLTTLGADLLTKVQEIEEEIVVTSMQESIEADFNDMHETVEVAKQLQQADVGFESPFSIEELERLLEESDQPNDQED